MTDVLNKTQEAGKSTAPSDYGVPGEAARQNAPGTTNANFDKAKAAGSNLAIAGLPSVEIGGLNQKDDQHWYSGILPVAGDIASGAKDEVVQHPGRVLEAAALAAATIALAPEIAAGAATIGISAGVLQAGSLAAGAAYAGYQAYEYGGDALHNVNVVANPEDYSPLEQANAHKGLKDLGAVGMDVAAGVAGGVIAGTVRGALASAAQRSISGAGESGGPGGNPGMDSPPPEAKTSPLETAAPTAEAKPLPTEAEATPTKAGALPPPAETPSLLTEHPVVYMDANGTVTLTAGTDDFARPIVNGRELAVGETVGIDSDTSVKMRVDVGDAFPVWKNMPLKWGTSPDGSLTIGGKTLSSASSQVFKSSDFTKSEPWSQAKMKAWASQSAFEAKMLHFYIGF